MYVTIEKFTWIFLFYEPDAGLYLYLPVWKTWLWLKHKETKLDCPDFYIQSCSEVTSW